MNKTIERTIIYVKSLIYLVKLKIVNNDGRWGGAGGKGACLVQIICAHLRNPEITLSPNGKWD